MVLEPVKSRAKHVPASVIQQRRMLFPTILMAVTLVNEETCDDTGQPRNHRVATRAPPDNLRHRVHSSATTYNASSAVVNYARIPSNDPGARLSVECWSGGMPLITRPTESIQLGDVEHPHVAADDVAQALRAARYPCTVPRRTGQSSSSLDSLTTALARRDTTEPCRYRTRRLGTALLSCNALRRFRYCAGRLLTVWRDVAGRRGQSPFRNEKCHNDEYQIHPRDCSHKHSLSRFGTPTPRRPTSVIAFTTSSPRAPNNR
jgi:hypothetical protein